MQHVVANELTKAWTPTELIQVGEENPRATGGNAYVWGAYTQAINTNCGRAWGHGGNFPGLSSSMAMPNGRSRPSAFGT